MAKQTEVPQATQQAHYWLQREILPLHGRLPGRPVEDLRAQDLAHGLGLAGLVDEHVQRHEPFHSSLSGAPPGSPV